MLWDCIKSTSYIEVLIYVLYDVRCIARLQLQRVSKNNFITCVNGAVYDYGHSDYSSN